MEKLRLVEPSEAMVEALRDFLADYGEGYEATEGMWWAVGDDPAAILRRCCENSQGINLPEGYVPSTTYFLVNEQETILGALNLRHCLSDTLLNYGGHIGYSIRPSARGQGYGTRMLALGLEEAQKRGIPRVLITCKSENQASARIIEKNGGVLESEKPALLEGKPILSRHYWIDIESKDV